MYITYFKLMMLLGAVSTVFAAFHIYMLKRTRKRLNLTNAMLETDYNIMELSQKEQQETLNKLSITNAMIDTGCNIMDMGHSELLDSYNKLSEANERAKESSRMKSNFIKQISHEIRTPLNILSGYAQILTTPGLEIDEKEKTQIHEGIVENTTRITCLVNKMLELSDASSKTVIKRTNHTSATELVNIAINKSGIEDAQDVSFILDMNDEAGRTELLTNLDSATRALAQLLDNACKFSANSDNKEIRLCVTATANNVEFAVEDHGIGVPARETEHIFEEFVQLDEYYEGTGIGLTVSRSQARRIGGDIVIDTSYTSGARFILTLPR